LDSVDRRGICVSEATENNDSFTNQTGIVFGTAAKDFNRSTHFLLQIMREYTNHEKLLVRAIDLSSDDRIKLAIFCLLCEVDAVLFERLAYRNS
jgi:hypothetical protein